MPQYPSGRRVTVGATKLLIGARVGRYKLAIKNLETTSGNDIDLGGPEVTAGGGHVVKAGETLWIDDYDGPLWAVASADRSCSIMELF